jgi:uncharacterized UBP type Zn finger protein
MPNLTGRQNGPSAVRPCVHLAAIRPVEPHTTGCQQCIDDGTDWVTLSLCLSCGWVACAQDSPNHHAQAHYEETNHPITTTLPHSPHIRWCYVHQRHV